MVKLSWQNVEVCVVSISDLFAAEVLSEEVILKWHKDSHSSRGWTVFMDQVKPFIEWLEKAEEGE